MTLEVGGEKVIFRVHRNLLCSKAKFFEGCLTSGFSEASENRIVFEKDSPIAVAKFIDWLYTGFVTIEIATTSSGEFVEF